MTKNKLVFAALSTLCVATLSVASFGCGDLVLPDKDDAATSALPEASLFDGPERDGDRAYPPPDEDGGSSSCPAPGAIAESDFGVTFAPPGPAQAVCTQSDLDALKAVFAKGGGSATFAAIEASLTAACAPCVFTDVNAARWGVVIKQNGVVVLDNSLAACFGVLSTDACAKAAFDIDTCLVIACPSECGDPGSAEAQACQQKALKAGDVCGGFVDPYVTMCPTSSELTDTCGGFLNVIQITCGGGPNAGLDASQ